MNFVKIFLLILIIFSAPSVLAHPGHDHNSVYATLVHMLWVLPVIAAIGVTFYFSKKNSKEDH